MTTDTVTSLLELAEMREKATKGLWTNFHEDFDKDEPNADREEKTIRLGGTKEKWGGCIYDEGQHTIDDARFIVASANFDFRAAADEMKRMREALESIQWECDGKEDVDDGIPNLAMKCSTIAQKALNPKQGE